MTSDMEGVKDDDFDGLLDKIEAKYCAKIMTLFGNQPEEKVDGFTEEWFFSDFFSDNPFIMLQTDAADELSQEAGMIQQFYRFNVPMVADSTQHQLSTNNFVLGNEENKTHEQIARTAMATMISLIFDMCTEGKQFEEEDAEERDDHMSTMEDNWKEILKYSDEDLGIMKGTRGGLLHLIKMWTDFMKGDITVSS